MRRARSAGVGQASGEETAGGLGAAVRPVRFQTLAAIFSRAGSWVLVCQRIRELQVLDDSGSAPDKNVMSLE